ncbi:hypothetical protein L3V82_08120 [Thiotrichales bacterium 19S3-7]|nr:hypothetical protein [Thiotrichales bacterium 19S3-7]MCF6803123.1 hypothetical protein [Thiotrichales bacterium 19S3-11]
MPDIIASISSLATWGRPKHMHHRDDNLRYNISRTVMRNPNENVKNQLFEIHKALATSFSHMSDNALNWLIGGSKLKSRGGFNTATQLRNFLNQPPDAISSSRLIMGIESLLTAISYRHIRADWVSPPYYPETQDQKSICNTIDDIVRPQLVASINSTYTNRGDDFVSNKAKDETTQVNYNDDVSDASDVEEDSLKKPVEHLDNQYFRNHVAPNLNSWVYSASLSGIPIRAHVSGTTALNLAAAEGLLRNADGSLNDWLSNENNLKALSGVLIIPQYFRSDFHTFAETAAGIKHYLDQRSLMLGIKITPEALTPKQAESFAFECLSLGVNTTLNNNGVTPKQAIEEVKNYIESSIIPYPSYSSVDFNQLKSTLAHSVSSSKSKAIMECNSLQEICYISSMQRGKNILGYPKSAKILCELLNQPMYAEFKKEVRPSGLPIRIRDIRAYALNKPEPSNNLFMSDDDKSNESFFIKNKLQCPKTIFDQVKKDDDLSAAPST